jgi:cytoskeletal protein CcmA (bactofilin family)
MFGGVKKVPTTCPHCGFVQLEPRDLISTYCRGCGDHYTVLREPGAAPRSAPSVAERLRTRMHRGAGRRIICSECGTRHTVSALCKTANCPSCGVPIDLRDVVISAHSTRTLDIRGTVHVERKGYLNAPGVTCENAFIEGRLGGRMRCAGTLRMRGEGLCRAQIRTRHLIFDRGARLRFAFPIEAGEVLIRGAVEADIACGGAIHVGRHGRLEGSVRARAMVVDKGGCYAGSVEVAATPPEPMKNGTAPEFPRLLRVMPAWRTEFAAAW